MNLDSTKNGSNFPLDILFHAYFNSGCACEEGKQSAFNCTSSGGKKLEDSDSMEDSDFIQVQVKYLSPAVYI